MKTNLITIKLIFILKFAYNQSVYNPYIDQKANISHNDGETHFNFYNLV